ncbi:hypothetical protein LTR74_018725, partial [Friedmanniomyces endolithicus]
MVLALLNLGGSQAFQSIYGLASGALILSYILSIGSLLWRKCASYPCMLGRWHLPECLHIGRIVNGLALLYLLQLFVADFFPFSPPQP